MRRICVIGAGYVGLVTGTCFADLGNPVVCVDVVPEKIDKLNRGETPRVHDELRRGGAGRGIYFHRRRHTVGRGW